MGADIMFPLEGYFGPETYVITSKKTSIEDVTKMMLDQYEMTEEQAKNDVHTFVTRLLEAGILEA